MVRRRAGVARSRRPRQRLGWSWRLLVVVFRPLLTVTTRRHWHGLNHLPADGPVIVAVNHISVLDPFVVAHACYGAGRIPRFLTKSELFAVPVLRTVLRGAGHIPVYRDSADASLALREATAALAHGECVVVYPEGTTTGDPGFWPMRARTGVARLALATGAPVVPMAQFGIQRLTGPVRAWRPGRVPVDVRFGRAVDLSSYQGLDATSAVLRAATDEVMAAVRELLEEIRGEVAPDTTADPRPGTGSLRG